MSTDGKIIVIATLFAIAGAGARAFFGDICWEEVFVTCAMGVTIIYSQLTIRELEKRLPQ